MNLHELAIGIAAVLLGLGILVDCNATAHEYDDDVVAVARLAVNEASFATTDDHVAIALVVARNARRAGLSPAEYVATRHVRIGSTRPWVRDLDATLDRPEGWPEADVPWESVGRAKWAAVLARVASALHGRARLRCEASTWGGTIDAERIARMSAAGWEVVGCGFTANTFLRRSNHVR